MQVVPHITDEIKQRIALIAESSDVDFVITEIGGTVGDIESLPFLEAIRQFPVDVGRRRCMFIHLTLVPYIGHAGELKTKPTQHSVNELRRIGIQPDMLVCRSEGALSARHPQEDRAVREPAGRGDRLRARRRQHLQGAADLPRGGRRRLHPRALRAGGAGAGPVELAGARSSAPTGRRAPCGSRSSASTCSSRTPTCRCPRRCATPASRQDARVEIDWVDSERSSDDGEARASASQRADGILIPGGFGGRGIEGKIAAARVAREQRDPVPRHLPRHAGRGRRVRAPRRRHGRRQLDRVRPRDAATR